MSLHIIKHGVLDTIQDNGRYGFQHLGINPGGVMDMAAMKVANLLVGNDAKEAVLEMHFPAIHAQFLSDTIMALSGADFGACLDGLAIETNRCILVKAGSEIRFTHQYSGARVYLAIHKGFDLPCWLNSKSTNVKAASGGYQGRALKTGDIIRYTSRNYLPFARSRSLSWKAGVKDLYHHHPLRFIPGAESSLLTTGHLPAIGASGFSISTQSDRMGYRLEGEKLLTREPVNLISAGVSKGDIQLLPDGQLIILMADHQTTGGYPVIGHIITSDLPTLAQKQIGEKLFFEQVTIVRAQQLLFQQHLFLLQLKHSCDFKLIHQFGKA